MKTFSEIIYEMQAWLRSNNLNPEDYTIRCGSEISERQLVNEIKRELGIDRMTNAPVTENHLFTIRGTHINSR